MCDIFYIAPNAFEFLKDLKEIRLYGNKVSDDYPLELAGLDSLDSSLLFEP
jgi:hypothetical protein